MPDDFNPKQREGSQGRFPWWMLIGLALPVLIGLVLMVLLSMGKLDRLRGLWN